MTFPPDDYRDDPEGYAANQAGHAFVGVALAICLAGFIPATWAWIVAGAGYWLIWERLWQRGRLLRDSAEDAVFVTAGAALWCMGHLYDWRGATVGLAATMALMGVGVWRRAR